MVRRNIIARGMVFPWFSVLEIIRAKRRFVNRSIAFSHAVSAFIWSFSRFRAKISQIQLLISGG